MRLFFAIELPLPPLEHLAAMRDRMRHSLDNDFHIAWTPTEKLHITLKFLGEVADEPATRLMTRLSNAALGTTMCLHAAGVECFPARGKVRVLTASIAANSALFQVHQHLDSLCANQGFSAENRPFRPHVTLGRCHRPCGASLRGRVAEMAKDLLPGPDFVVTSIALMQSKLTHGGSQYVPLARFNLKPAD
jgi:2'-5' RNA ligase